MALRWRVRGLHMALTGHCHGINFKMKRPVRSGPLDLGWTVGIRSASFFRGQTERGAAGMTASGGATPVTRRRRDQLIELGRRLVKRDEGDLASVTVRVALTAAS